jgi:hypothetical protein
MIPLEVWNVHASTAVQEQSLTIDFASLCRKAAKISPAMRFGQEWDFGGYRHFHL